MTALAARTAGGSRHPVPSTALVAGLPQRSLDECYEACRVLNAAHGRTYYFATRFLPVERRRHVYALYGFARYADDLVDHMALAWSVEERRAALEAWSADFLSCLDGGRSTHDPVLRAALATVAALRIRREDLEAFLTSMAMDLTVSRYRTYADLRRYVHGSAAVIGSMMLPVLGADEGARRPAMDLGVAFQLTNFLRDVAEDWERGRIYLPLEDLERFGVGEWDFHARHVGPAFRRLLAFEAARARALYRSAEDGWALLPRGSRACIRIAHRCYGGILDALESCDYQVFRHRASVPGPRRVAIALRETLRPSAPGHVRLG